jgi:hypothetical protein
MFSDFSEDSLRALGDEPTVESRFLNMSRVETKRRDVMVWACFRMKLAMAALISIKIAEAIMTSTIEIPR